MAEVIVDHRDLVASLSTEQRKHLTEKSDLRGLLHMATHFSAIALTGTLIALGVPGWPILLPIQGVLIMFLFTLLHEAGHKTAFRTVWINSAVAQFCGLLVGVQAIWFRYFHFAHHRHTQDVDNDPELESVKPETRWQYAAHVSGIPLWWTSAKTLVKHAIEECVDPYVPAAARRSVMLEARFILALYSAFALGSIAFASSILVWIWIVPILLGQPFLRLYLLAEHGRCPLVANMLENSRTTFTNCVVRWLAWNMPYHAEHHSFPAVPFHKLPEFHAIANDKLRTTEQGYGRFNKAYVTSLAS